MLINYLKMAFKNIKHHLGFSVINIVGLGTGLACVILILLWVEDEISYDRFHEKSDKIGRIIMDLDDMQLPASPGPLAALMIKEFPEIRNAVRFVWGSGILQYKTKKFEERDLMLVEPAFFEIFSFPFVKGHPGTALDDPGSIVLTETAAKKYFGDENPMGKTLQYFARVDRPLIVTGILKDIPHNSSLKFDFLASFELCRDWKEPDSWTASQDYQTYILTDENATIEQANQNLEKFCKKYFAGHNIRMFIQPLQKIHLYSNFKFDSGHGDILYVFVFSIIALVVLIIACINFMNLSTARYTKRTKEVGIRKAAGANQLHLIKQFLTESLIITSFALVLAFLMIELALPLFKDITGKPISLNYSDARLIVASIILLLFTGIFSGAYPAFFLSNFKPASILKPSMFSANNGALFRKMLVVTQFTLSIIVIAGTIVMSDQLTLMRNKKLGYDKTNLIWLRTSSYFSHKYKPLQQDLLQSKNITHVTVSNDIPTRVNLNTGADWEGKTDNDKYIGFRTIVVNEDYLDTYGMSMARGRFYSKAYPSDFHDGFVVNETAVKAMGLQNPIGKRFSAWDKNGRIIGVVNDFHFKSVKEEVEPLILHLGHDKRFYSYLTLRINSQDVSETLSYIRKTWEKHFPDHLYEIHFLDRTLDQLYSSEEQVKTIFSYFALMAIFLSCLGLFGLAVFMAQQKTKEIGVRKVFGASLSGIVVLLSKDFLKWVITANLLAWPIAYYAMNRWLQDFAYRIDLTIWPFLLAGLLALAIALLTVGWQAFRAATANPVEALRYE